MLDLYSYYKSHVVKKLIDQFQYHSIMQVPVIDKITLNIGINQLKNDKKTLDKAVSDLTLITGQKPIITKSKKSIAGFKIRKGYPIGCKVTLRGVRKWDFLNRFIKIVIPRIRDFRGFSKKSFDGRGNYNIGIKEQIIFPEINYDTIDKVRGLNITITTTAKNNIEGLALLSFFNFPFQK
ncbi:50S ribosomal protein L5 [Buchnera aphidicola (Pterocallis alni)]|uniref:50S ribosomal protein L5 n=1 Tax=Buchnera aphidicola TaxID=9 RepID=UPI00346447B2